MIQSILIATDGSDTAKRAVEVGGKLAKEIGAAVHVVTAYKPLRTAKVAGASPEAWHIPSDAKAEAVLADACAFLRLHGVEPEPHAREGDPADAILDAAEESGIDLIVLGNQGMTGSKRFMLGNVPNRVSHHAGCNVMIVRTD